VCALLSYRGSRLAAVALGFGLGLAVPVTLGVRDGLQALVSMAKTLTGGNVNADVAPFSNADRLLERPLREGLVLLAFAAVAAVIGARHGNPAPIVLFFAAAAMGVMALARLADAHYFAPPFVLASASALWLAARFGRIGGVAAAVVTAAIVWPQFADRTSPRHDFEAFADRSQPLLQFTAERLEPREVALTPDYYPHADVRWFGVVRPFAPFDDYPYEFMPVGEPALTLARSRGLRPRYAVDVSAEALAVLGVRSRPVARGVRSLEYDEAAEG
jgi:hypothetical protein